MALVIADRVKVTTTTTGTGDLSLAAASTGFQDFTAVGDGNTTYYAVSSALGSEWEVGLGTYTAAGPSLSRDTILGSSNSGSAVNFSAGTKDVYVVAPADKSILKDASGNVNEDITGNAATATILETARTIAGQSFDGSANISIAPTDLTGVTATASEINILDGATLDVDELNLLDGVTATTTELNYVDGVTSAIQTQLDAKVAKSGDTMTGALTLNADPSSALHAATKQYVDTQTSAGIHYHAPVRGEVSDSEGNLNATYNNGTAGVGATLTNAGANAAFNYGGISDWSTTERVLIYAQTDQTQNGVYTVTTVGDGSTPWVLTRATDADSAGASDPDALGTGDAFFVQEGNGAGELYVMNTEGTITFGTTNITFTQIASAAIYSAGSGLDLTGTVFSHDDTSSQASVNNSGNTFIQDVTLDGFGHVTGLTSATAVINDGTLTMATSGTGLSGSASFTANDSDNVTFTVTSNATNANTGSTIVARDASGNFSAGTITASLSGNASTATTLATSRTLQISGDATGSASFDGSANANISISLAADSVAASEIAANAVGASELNVSGNGTTSQFLRSDGDGTFTWATPTDTNTTYSAGTLLDLSGTTFNVDLSELSTSTTSGDGSYFVVVDGSNVQRKLTKANINISGFNNDAGYTTNVGDITGVTAGSGLTGGGSSGSVTLNVGAGTGVSVAADSISVNYGTTSTTACVGNDSRLSNSRTCNNSFDNAATARSNLGLGSLATLSTVNASTITDNSVGAAELNVSGNGTTSQFLRSDGDGTFTWATPTDTNTTYSAGAGLDLSGTTFSIESDLRDGITHIGLDSTDFIYFVNNSRIDFYVNNSNKFRMESDGDFHADGDVIAYSTTVSDERLKEEIQTVDNALAMVNQMRGVTFKYKKDGKESAGVVAQELEQVFPRAVSEKKLPLKTDDDLEYKTVQYDQLHAVLIEAVKELSAKVKELEAKVG
jgi:hypothetical protein